MGMERKATLKWYKTKRIPKSELFYDGSWAGQLLFKARTNSLEVNVRTYRWNESRQRMCMQCGMGVDETVEHMFLECERYANEREVLMECVSEAVGVSEWNEIRAGVDHGRCCLLGLGKVRKVCVIEAAKVFLEDGWGRRRMNEERNLQPAVIIV